MDIGPGDAEALCDDIDELIAERDAAYEAIRDADSPFCENCDTVLPCQFCGKSIGWNDFGNPKRHADDCPALPALLAAVPS